MAIEAFKLKYCAITYLLFASVFSQRPASAEDVSQVVERSDVIAVVHITSATDVYTTSISNGCGFAYDAFASIAIKGAREGQRISFRSQLPLAMSGTYLVFLSDQPQQSPGNLGGRLLNIQSSECRESGITHTPIEYLPTSSSTFGPKLVLEHRRISVSGESSEPREVHEFFVGPLLLEKLFVSSSQRSEAKVQVRQVEISRPNYTQVEAAFELSSLLSFLKSLSESGGDYREAD